MLDEFISSEGPDLLLEEVTKAIKGLKEKKAHWKTGMKWNDGLLGLLMH